MTLDTARRIVDGMLLGQRGKIFDQQNDGDIECINALEVLLSATKATSTIDTAAPSPAAPARRRR